MYNIYTAYYMLHIIYSILYKLYSIYHVYILYIIYHKCIIYSIYFVILYNIRLILKAIFDRKLYSAYRLAKRENGYQESRVKTFRIHPEYDPHHVYADLAVLEMQTPFKFNNYVKVLKIGIFYAPPFNGYAGQYR